MKKIFLAAAVFMSLQAGAQLSNHYKIYDAAKGKEVTLEAMIDKLKDADVVFFGEDHQDSVGHLLELEVYKGLHKAHGSDQVLSLEMFEADVQLILDEYLSGYIKDKNLVKDGRAWKNYQTDYRPMVDYAKANKLRVVAANTPSRYTNAVTAGSLKVLDKADARAKAILPPLPIDTATGLYLERFKEVMGGHGDMPSMYIYHSQNLWDAGMGWAVYKQLKADPASKVMQVNGSFHSNEKLGAVQQLKKYAAKDKKTYKIMNISSFPDGAHFSSPEWEEHKSNGDFVIITDKIAAE